MWKDPSLVKRITSPTRDKAGISHFLRRKKCFDEDRKEKVWIISWQIENKGYVFSYSLEKSNVKMFWERLYADKVPFPSTTLQSMINANLVAKGLWPCH